MDPGWAEWAAERVAWLFEDGGASVRSEGALGPSWAAAFETVPDRFVEGLDDTDDWDTIGEQVLQAAREHWSQAGEMRAAIAVTRGLVQRRAARLGEAHPDTLVELGALAALADRAGKLAEAEGMFRRAWDGLRALDDLRAAVVATNFALHMLRMRQVDRAEELLTHAHRLQTRHAPESTGLVSGQLGELLLRRGKGAEAAPLLKEAWDRYRGLHGASDPRTLARARMLATTLVQLERFGEALPVLRNVHQAAIDEKDDEKRVLLAFQLASALEAAGKLEEASRLADDGIRWTRANGDPHPDFPARITLASQLASKRGRFHEAEGFLREALDVEARIHGEASAETGQRHSRLALFLLSQGRLEEARGHFEVAVTVLRSTLGAEAWQTKYAAEALVDILVAEAKRAKDSGDAIFAVEILEHARRIAIPILGARHKMTLEIEKIGL